MQVTYMCAHVCVLWSPHNAKYFLNDIVNLWGSPWLGASGLPLSCLQHSLSFSSHSGQL